MPTLVDLQNTFNIDHINHNQVRIIEGQGGLPMLTVRNKFASAEIYMQGAQLTDFTPHGKSPVLWLSQQSLFENNRAIRGGVPICWPWFGADPDNASNPAHGFARISIWSLDRVEALEDGATLVQLSLTDNGLSRKYWPQQFEAVFTILIAETLTTQLTTKNTGAKPFTYSEALHSYLSIADIHQIQIDGLQNTTYADKMDDMNLHCQNGAVNFSEETDRVYLDTIAPCTVNDLKAGRAIEISKQGSLSTVVWNPWITKSAGMSDFADDEWRNMVCVETANLLEHAITLDPGQSHTLQAIIGLKSVETGNSV